MKNCEWAIDWHYNIRPWMILNRPSSRSLQLRSNISITVYGMQQHWAVTRSIERISCSTETALMKVLSDSLEPANMSKVILFSVS